jgi:predicted nucleotidyltransferase
MKPELDLDPQHMRLVRDVLRRLVPEDATVWVFGSRSKGTARRGSDLDIAIELNRPLTRAESEGLRIAFEASDLPYKVDVIELNGIGATFRAAISQDLVQLNLLPSDF